VTYCKYSFFLGLTKVIDLKVLLDSVEGEFDVFSDNPCIANQNIEFILFSEKAFSCRLYAFQTLQIKVEEFDLSGGIN